MQLWWFWGLRLLLWQCACHVPHEVDSLGGCVGVFLTLGQVHKLESVAFGNDTANDMNNIALRNAARNQPPQVSRCVGSLKVQPSTFNQRVSEDTLALAQSVQPTHCHDLVGAEVDFLHGGVVLDPVARIGECEQVFQKRERGPGL